MKCVKCGQEIPDDAVFCPYCGKKQSAQSRKKKNRRPNGMGTISHVPGKRKKPVYARLPDGTLVGTFKNGKEAEEALNRIIASDRKITDSFNMTFAEVYEEWSQEHDPKITKASAQAYRRCFEKIKSLHDVKFRDLRTKDFQEIINELRDNGKSYSTLSKYKQLFTQMSDWAVREEIITNNFAKFVELPKQTAHSEKIFSDEDIRKLKEDGSETAMIVLMLIDTGMRINELFTLPLENYYGTYVVGGEKTEAGRNRTIPIRPEGRRYFEYFADRATGPLLLSGYSGQHTAANFRRRDYYPLLEKLDIEKITPHRTRHTYATWADNNDMPDTKLHKIMGHVDISTTEKVYMHPDAEHLVEAVEKAENVEKAKKRKEE